MTAVAIAAVLLAALRFARWHGRKMYALGVEHGRSREALDAKHASERLLMDAKIETTLGAIQRVRDRQMIARWTTEWFKPPS